MLCLHLLFFVELRERIWHGYPDFTVFYTAATILRQGLGPQLYDERTQYRVQEEFAGNIGSPYREAFVAWGLLNALALFGVALILRRNLEVMRSIPAWKLVLSFLAFFPIFLCFLQGQDSILVLLVCTLAYAALKKEMDVLAGCWLAMGTVKLQMVLPVVLLLLLWRRKRVAAGFAGVAIVLAAVSFLLVGWHGLLQYPGYVLQIAREPGLGGVPAELMPNLRGLVEGWPWKLAPSLVTALVVAGSGILIFFAARKGSAGPRTNFDLQFSMAVVVTALVSWHTNAHDLALLILPLVLLANYGYSRREDSGRAKLAVMLPALPLLISPLWIALWLSASKLNLMAIPLLWWGWAIGREVARSTYSAPELSS
jgi:hypothetical protein